jgi:toxin secretion/phage lysis holin
MNLDGAKIAAAAPFGLISAWFGSVWVMVAFAFGSILLDYATGMLAGRANEGLNSKRATRGLYKKVGILFLLFFGFLLDGAFAYFITHGLVYNMSFDLPFNLPIGMIISAWIVITESISICENLQRLDVPIPRWIVFILKKAQSNADKKGMEE